MLTRCPSCDVTFRVTPEQLKTRGGKVRCGACHQVFNALETLNDEPVVVLADATEIPNPATTPGTLQTADMPEFTHRTLATDRDVTGSEIAVSNWGPMPEPASSQDLPPVASHAVEFPSVAEMLRELPDAPPLAATPVAITVPAGPVAEAEPEVITVAAPGNIARTEAAKPDGVLAGEPNDSGDTAAAPIGSPAHSTEQDSYRDAATAATMLPDVSPATVPPSLTDSQADAQGSAQAHAHPNISDESLTESALVDHTSTLPVHSTSDAPLAVPFDSSPPVSALSDPATPPAASTGPAHTEPALADSGWAGLPEVRRPLRWPWAIGSLFALVALCIQAALMFRVELAVREPEVRPVLEALCQFSGCEVGLPRKVDLVSIEVSDLHPDPAHPPQLALSATLKNRANFAQQLPYLELTLTDAADKAIARKVLKPADYVSQTPISSGKPDKSLPDRMPANGDLVVALNIDPGDIAASGYRLYLFYP